MILIVRDEDTPTVAAAINAFADEEGLESVPLESLAQSQNPFDMLGVLAAPRVLVAMSGEQVVVTGLESLDIAEPEEWGASMSSSCDAEVIVVDVADDGLHVGVFDDGEPEETITVAWTPGAKADTSALATLADDDEASAALEKGISARTVSDLLAKVLDLLGAASPEKDSVVMLAFHDPLDEEEGADADVVEAPALVVEALPAASLEGKVGGPVASIRGTVFGVTLVGAPETEGVRIAVGGDALSLFAVDSIEVDLRRRGGYEILRRVVKLDEQTKTNASAASGKGVLVIDLADAFLERINEGPPQIDMTDLFSSMQRLMSAGNERIGNTIMVQINGTGLRVGEATLTLEAQAMSSAVGESETPGEASQGDAPVPIANGFASIPVRVL